MVLCKIKDFFDSGYNICMIKRSALSKDVIISYLMIPNLWEPLQVTLKCKKLPQCKTRDCLSLIKTGISINKRFQCLTMTMSNMISTWVQTCFPILNSSQTTQKEDWNGLISPSHFVHLVVWIQTNSMPWKTCLTSKPKTRSLAKIDSKALQQRFWTPSMKRQISWGHEMTHSSKCTSKGILALSATGEQKEVWWNS